MVKPVATLAEINRVGNSSLQPQIELGKINLMLNIIVYNALSQCLTRV